MYYSERIENRETNIEMNSVITVIKITIIINRDKSESNRVGG
jgi:hypothetical protein